MPGHLFARFRDDHRGNARDSEMLRQIRAFDWSKSAAGCIDSWPDELKFAVRTMLLAEAPMAVMIGRSGILLYNDACRTVFGAHYDAALGRSAMLVLPEAAPTLDRILRTCYEGQGVRLRDEPLRLRRNGETKTGWFSASFTPVADEEAHIFGAIVSISETTDRMRALGALQQSRRRMEIALNAGGIVGTWDFDVTAGRISINSLLAELLGISADAARQGIDIQEMATFIHSDDRDKALRLFGQALANGTECQDRFRMVLHDGEIRWLQAYGRPVRNRSGVIVQFAGVLTDISEQIRAEAALEQSNVRFDILAESVPQIVWSNDADGRHDYFNRRWREFTGIEETADRTDGWVDLIHPDDRLQAKAHWQDCLRTGRNYDMEYRYRFHDGSYRWLRALAMPVRDSDGRIIRWYGTSTDIHSAKEVEEQRAVIAHELDHRIKNLFALTNALVTLSVRDQPDLRSLANGLSSRLIALHQAHGLIYNDANVQSGSLYDLLGTLLRPYDCGQIMMEGPDQVIMPKAVTAMALLFHELVTNAAKYGALSNPEGVLKIMFGAGEGRHVISWVESFPAQQDLSGNITHSAAIMLPQAESVRGDMVGSGGFGSRLLDMIVVRQLRGTFNRSMGEDHLNVHIDLPLSALTDHNTGSVH